MPTPMGTGSSSWDDPPLSRYVGSSQKTRIFPGPVSGGLMEVRGGGQGIRCQFIFHQQGPHEFFDGNYLVYPVGVGPRESESIPEISTFFIN